VPYPSQRLMWINSPATQPDPWHLVMRWCSSAPIARSRLSTRLRRYPFSPVGSHPSDDWQYVGLLRCLRCFYVRQHRRSTKADTRIPRTQGETSRPGQLADTSIRDWHRAQRKIECWAITRLARRGQRASEPCISILDIYCSC
jgi:hypothetical protein